MNASGDTTSGDGKAPISEPADTEPADTEPVDAEIVPLEPAGAPTATAHPIAVEPQPIAPDPGYTDSGVPTFDAVRERIEQRIGRAIGHSELDAASTPGRDVEEAWERRQKAAQEKLEQIRASMKRDAAGDPT